LISTDGKRTRVPSRPFFPIADTIREIIALEFDMWTRRLLMCLLLTLTMLHAMAAPRSFPANAKRGVLTADVFPQVVIDGQIQRLSPGAKIISQKNTIVMTSVLMNNAYTVNYTVDAQGFIDRIWILTDEEMVQNQ
jgi:hypothetical protein